MNQQEIKKAIEKGEKLKWNDPDPIKGNDYTILKIFDLNDETAVIHYGSDVKYCSEAEVFLNEISKLED